MTVNMINALSRTKEFGDLLQQYQDEIDTFREKEVLAVHTLLPVHKACCLEG